MIKSESTLSKKAYTIGVILKIGVVVSCILGLYFSCSTNPKATIGPMMLYFTIQSNIWIAFICAVFLIIDLLTKGNRNIGNWLYVIKFMFTVAIMLTFLVFAVMLSPLMPKSFLLSPPNIFLHNITPILALIDFLICDYGYVSSKKHILFGLLMPLYYIVFALSLSFAGVKFNGEIVPYFFFNYQELGWLTIGGGKMGVIYWFLILFVLLLIVGTILLKLKDIRYKKLNPLVTEQEKEIAEKK